MDWNSIKARAESLTEKVAPVFEKVKGYTKSVADFTGKQLRMAIITIKSIEEYEKLLSEKKVILIASSENSISYWQLALRYVLFLKDAWAMSAKLRFIDIVKNPEIAATLKIVEDPTLIVMYQWFEYKRFIGMEHILDWWRDGAFYDTPDKKTDSIVVPSEIVDPLMKPLQENQDTKKPKDEVKKYPWNKKVPPDTSFTASGKWEKKPGKKKSLKQ